MHRFIPAGRKQMKMQALTVSIYGGRASSPVVFRAAFEGIVTIRKHRTGTPALHNLRST
jgi:hypothetical protein